MEGTLGPAGQAAALVFVAAACLPAPVLAEELPTATLHYDASSSGEPCPEERALRDLVVARMGRDPFPEDAPETEEPEIEARVVAGDDGLSAIIEVRSHDGAGLGRRRIAAARGECEELVTALAVAIAIVLDPATSPLAEQDDEPSTEEQEATEQTPGMPARPEDHVDSERPPLLREGVPERAAPPPTPSPPRDGISVGLSASLIASVGILPDAAIGGAMSAEARWKRLLAGLELRMVSSPGGTSIGGLDLATTRASVGAVPCLAMGAVAACVPIDVGVLELRPPNDVPPARSVVANLGLRLLLAWPIGDVVELRAWAESAVPLIQPTIRVDGEPAWTSPPVTATVGLGIAVWP